MFDQYRKTQADILLNHIIENYEGVKNRANTELIPVVKANAYGHGAIEVTRLLVDHGVKLFAVSLLEEALELRNVFKDIEILVMGVVEDEDIVVASNQNIILTVTSLDQLKYVSLLNQPLKVHIKVDTGMHRLGFNTVEEIKDVLDHHPMLDVEGIYTHFATADCDEAYYLKQLSLFKDILKTLDHPFKRVHVSNSSASIKYESDFEFTTHARLGISLYGCTLDKGMDFLKPTMVLKTKISHIRTLKKGDKLGYGLTYEASEEERIGVLPIGYADGFIRMNQGGDVMINHKRYPLVGRICMDQCFIKIDDHVTKDDHVNLFGEGIHIDEVASRLQTINYEVLCSVSHRVPRVYRKD